VQLFINAVAAAYGATHRDCGRSSSNTVVSVGHVHKALQVQQACFFANQTALQTAQHYHTTTTTNNSK
jgi:hypothetical protein